MRRSSRRQILFDLMSKAPDAKGKTALSVPEWWSNGRDEPVDDQAVDVATDNVALQPTPAPAPTPARAPAPDSWRTTARHDKRAAEFHDHAPAVPAARDEVFAPADAVDAPGLDQNELHDEHGGADAPPNAAVTYHEGRWVLILSNTAGIMVAACLVIAASGLIYAGRNWGDKPPVTITSLNNDGDAAAGDPGGQPDTRDASQTPGPLEAGRRSDSGSGIGHLLGNRSKPSNTGDTADKVASAKTAETQARTAVQAGQKQWRLWIQGITFRGSSEQQVAEQDAAAIRKFLSDQGIETIAELGKSSLIIYSRDFPAGDERAADREAFRKRIAQLGQLYNAQGGGYSFEGCLWKLFK